MTLFIGERINAHGSRLVARLLRERADEALLEIAREQISGGAAAIDVCVAGQPTASEPDDMQRVVSVLAPAIDVPIVIDSTDVAVFARVLPILQGRAMINSTHLGLGSDAFRRVMELAQAYAAPVVVSCIDERGLARSRDRKFEIAGRVCEVALGDCELSAEALYLDPLAFPISARGGEEAARETIAAIDAIRRDLPVRTLLGLSNVSFGAPPGTRAAIESAFLRDCVDAGLDAAIVNTARLRTQRAPSRRA